MVSDRIRSSVVLSNRSRSADPSLIMEKSQIALIAGASLAVGVAIGAAVARPAAKKPSGHPRRVFKLCTHSELEKFVASGHVCSGLDTADGFVHLSDATSARTVAKLFFSDCKDLVLLEIDAWKFGAPAWVRDAAAPDKAAAPTAALARCGAATPRLVHYLYHHGCVHLYATTGETGGGAADVLPMAMVVRQAEVPLLPDGSAHVFPDWLPPADEPAC